MTSENSRLPQNSQGSSGQLCSGCPGPAPHSLKVNVAQGLFLEGRGDDAKLKTNVNTSGLALPPLTPWPAVLSLLGRDLKLLGSYQDQKIVRERGLALYYLESSWAWWIELGLWDQIDFRSNPSSTSCWGSRYLPLLPFLCRALVFSCGK